MWPSIVHPGIPAVAAVAPLDATGLSAKPSAQSTARKSLIIARRIGEEGLMSI